MTFTVRHLLTYTLLFTVLFIIGLFSGFDFITTTILSHNSKGFDLIMSVLTKWAEWPVIVLSLTLSFYVLGRKGWFWAAAFALEGLIIQGAKNWFNWPRPAVRFPEYVRTIDGNTLSQWKAFPSGHTAAVFFATAIIFSLWQTKWPRIFRIILLLLAFLVAYSRIYLGQHSFEDVLAGGLTGLWLYWAFHKLFQHKNWLES